MTIDHVLQRLSKVRQTGRDKWSACCPAHEDRKPSLSLKETDDGRVLLHCFAGCGACEILRAIGLEFSDLYPKTTSHHLPKARKAWNHADVLSALAFELLVAVQHANTLGTGKALDAAARARLVTCAARLQAGLGVANG